MTGQDCTPAYNGVYARLSRGAMRLPPPLFLAFALLVTGPAVWAAEATPDEKQAIAEIEKAGGKVEVFSKLPGKPQRVDLNNPKVTDDDLKPLKSLTNLQYLSLNSSKVRSLEHLITLKKLKFLELSFSGVTDEGLENLKGLSNLDTLWLNDTQVTDKGLEHLKGLTNLRDIHLLNDAKVTDKGLEHLKGLTNLQWIGARETKVSEAGAENLKKSLPKVKIAR